MEKEIVKIVNGVNIVRTPNTQRYYEIYFPYGASIHFETIKKATWYIECGLYECEKMKQEERVKRGRLKRGI